MDGLQGVERSLTYRREGLGWQIDLYESFGIRPEDAMTWDRRENPEAEDAKEATLKAQEAPLAPARQAAIEHFRRGLKAKSAGISSEAISAFREAIQTDPSFPRAHLLLGHCLEDDSQLQEAESEYRTALALDPAAVDHYYHLGRLLNRQKRFPEAVQILEEGLKRYTGVRHRDYVELEIMLREARDKSSKTP